MGQMGQAGEGMAKTSEEEGTEVTLLRTKPFPRFHSALSPWSPNRSSPAAAHLRRSLGEQHPGLRWACCPSSHKKPYKWTTLGSYNPSPRAREGCRGGIHHHFMPHRKEK